MNVDLAPADIIDLPAEVRRQSDNEAKIQLSRDAIPLPKDHFGQRFLLRVIVFAGGFSGIGIELGASRLIAPYFGSSTFIWANLIGLTLLYLSIGYYFGGRVADRYPVPWILYSVTAVAAFTTGLIPIMSRPILLASVTAFDRFAVGAFYGSLIAVLLFFAVPITLLGFVTPYVIRLRLSSVDAAGHTAGNVYALSTLGSIAGSFIPVLVLIPLMGTARSFLVLSLVLFLPAIAGLLTLRAIVPAIGAGLLALTLLVLTGSVDSFAIRPAQRGTLVYETESADNYIQVLQDDGTFLLMLNEGHAVHSIYNPNELLTRGPWDYFMVGPLFNQNAHQESTESAMLIGLAGGTVARQLTAAYGPIPIDGVEIDPEIARVGREFFAMESANLNIIVADGRYVLRTTDNSYDLIGVDAYRQPYIPFQLTTREFFQEIADHLNPNGVAVVNVGRTATDYRLVDVIASTMKSVYPHVYVIDVERFSNSIVVGTLDSTTLETFARQVEALPSDSILRTVGARAVESGNIREVAAGGRVFTDDHAPVELVVDQIILDVARRENGS
ncbi:MAG: fused MFS/spermidine synthase [Chloroflexia bacterium]|nr:fused MFS/spermidine synthase [Chloroflexia bacterium]